MRKTATDNEARMELKEKSKRPRLLIIAVVVVAVIAIAVISGIVIAGSGSNQNLRQKLDLGARYLSALDYEAAIATFDEVLQVDPSNEEAIRGMIDAYDGWIYALVEEGNYDAAFSVLDQASARFPDESVFQDRRDYLTAMKLAASHELTFSDGGQFWSQLPPYLEEVLIEVIDMLSRGEYSNIYEFIDSSSPSFDESLWSVSLSLLDNNVGEYRLFYSPKGTLGLYIISSDFGIYDSYPSVCLYWGDYENGIRSGNGVWLPIFKNIYYVGEWKNDAPNGKQTYYDSSTIFEGTAKNGLWDGIMVCTRLDDQEEVWPNEYVDGKLVDRNSKYVMGLSESDDGYYVGSESLYGLEGYGYWETSLWWIRSN